jgi:phage-related holin
MYTETLCFSSLKSFLIKLLMLVIAYFTPIAEMILVMLIFLLLDTISGIWASLKTGQKLESHKLRKTVYKIIWYTIAVMLSWMMEKTFTLTWTNLASLVCGFITFVELKSIFENITRITNEPVFLKILKIIKRKSTEAINEIGEDDEPANEGL